MEALSAEDVVRLVEDAQAGGKRLWPSGYGQRVENATGFAPLSLRRMASLQAYEPADLVVSAQAGMRLSNLNRELGRNGQWLPVCAPDGIDDSLGGMVASGLDGWYRGGYGSLRDRVLAMRVVAPAFGELRLGAAVVKNVAGYNLTRLLFGSRGALGIITEVTLKVAPRPQATGLWRYVLAGPDAAPSRTGELLAQAGPWAALVTMSVPGVPGLSLFAAWHGRFATIDRLARSLGPADAPAAIPALAEGPGVPVRGALPPAMLADLHALWPRGGALAAEWQSGWFWGTLPEDGAVEGLRDFVRSRGGSLRRIGADRPVDGQPQSAAALSLAVKRTFDPRGVLPPLT